MENQSGLARFEDIRHLIGNAQTPTPMVRLNHVIPKSGPTVYLKLEWMNPFGSVKDRPAQFMLQSLSEKIDLSGKCLVEATSGNTGIALSALAGLLGVPIRITVPSGVPEEKKIILRMLGAEVWETPDDLCPVDNPRDGAIALARSMTQSKGGEKFVMLNQYENADNVRAHYETTGPEIWRQTEGKVRTFVCGFGTCGTITGVGRFLKEKNPSIKVIAVEPQKGHKIPGLKNMQESKEPGILDRSLIDEVIRVDDGPAYEMTKRLFREEGLIVGPSTGAIVCAITKLKKQDEWVVGISPDSGFKYASFFSEILKDEGLPKI